MVHCRSMRHSTTVEAIRILAGVALNPATPAENCPIYSSEGGHASYL